MRLSVAPGNRLGERSRITKRKNDVSSSINLSKYIYAFLDNIKEIIIIELAFNYTTISGALLICCFKIKMKYSYFYTENWYYGTNFR